MDEQDVEKVEAKEEIMIQAIRRIIAVVLLIAVVWIVGYSCYTGSRLTNYPDKLDDYKGSTFEAKDGTMVAFTDENVWYGVDGESLILLEINEYKEGVITMQREETVYEFVAIDERTIYDTQTKLLLIRSGDG